MNADSGNPQTIDGIVSMHPREEGVRRAREFYEDRFDCEYITKFDPMPHGVGFEVRYNKLKITGAEAVMGFRGKLNSMKEASLKHTTKSDDKWWFAHINVHASDHASKKGHFHVTVDFFKDDYKSLFTKGFIEGYLLMIINSHGT